MGCRSCVSDAARRYGVSLTSASKAFDLAAWKTAFTAIAWLGAVISLPDHLTDAIGRIATALRG
jgi:hypothetical protein